jgi:putative acetyltransferase
MGQVNVPLIKPGDFEDARVQALLTRHLEGMHANSPPGHVFALDWSELQRAEISFYALWEGEELLGFGALKELNVLSGEIKSMRTADEHLRRGVAAAILEHIIAEARRRGYSRLSLETGSGPAFEPALTLYRKYGFVDGGAFGEYQQSSFNQFLHLNLGVHRAGRRPLTEGQRMDRRLRQLMLAYYDERAPEYEEAYTLGTGTASIPDPEVFKADARVLEGVVGREVRGRAIDLACGTAYWLPFYAANCSHVTLFDQSDRMLGEARLKASVHGVLERCDFVRGNFFEHEFPSRSDDTALIGFFLSHLTEEQEAFLFHTLRSVLNPEGRFLILDSAWSRERAMFNRKVERQARKLNDGTPFEIYKRYCDRGDISRWARAHGAELRVEHFGPAFFAVSGVFR